MDEQRYIEADRERIGCTYIIYTGNRNCAFNLTPNTRYQERDYNIIPVDEKEMHKCTIKLCASKGKRCCIA